MRINPRGDGRYGRLVERVERVTELPMFVLSLVYVLVLAAGYLAEPGSGLPRSALFVEAVIVAVFAAELAVKVFVARPRLSYLRENWLQVVIVVLPLLRPLRVLAVLRASSFILRGLSGVRRVLSRYQGANALVLGGATLLAGTGLVLVSEHDSGGPIRSFGDALWWALATVTSVGYGDVYPVTPAGRTVAFMVMVVGIAVFGVLTAGIAAYFVESSAGGDRESEERLDRILEKLDSLEERVEELDRRMRDERR